MNLKAEIILPSIRELSKSRTVERIRKFCCTDSDKHFMLIKTVIAEGFHQEIFNRIKSESGHNITLHSFSFFNSNVVKGLFFHRLLIRLLEQQELVFSESEKVIVKRLVTEMQIGSQELLLLLLTISRQKTVIIAFHQIEDAGSDFYCTLLALAAMLKQPEWQDCRIKIIGLFAEEHNSLFNNFIDELNVVDKTEIISCIPLHIRLWRKSLQEKNEHKTGRQFWLTAAFLADFIRNDVNGLEEIGAFLQIKDKFNSKSELKACFCRFGLERLALSIVEKQILYAHLHLLDCTKPNLLNLLQLSADIVESCLISLVDKGVLYQEQWQQCCRINGCYYYRLTEFMFLEEPFVKSLMEKVGFITSCSLPVSNLQRIYTVLLSLSCSGKVSQSDLNLVANYLQILNDLSWIDLEKQLLELLIKSGGGGDLQPAYHLRFLQLQIDSGNLKIADSLIQQYQDQGINFPNRIEKLEFLACKCEVLIKTRSLNAAKTALNDLRLLLKEEHTADLLLKYELLKIRYCLELYDYKTVAILLETFLKVCVNSYNAGYLTEAVILTAHIKHKSKKYTEALEICGKATEMIINNNLDFKKIVLLDLQAQIFLALKNYREALAVISQQLFFSRMYHQPVGEASAVKSLANLYKQTGFLKSAEKYYNKHLFFTLGFQDRYLISVSLFNLAEIAVDQGIYEQGMEYLKAHEELSLSLNHVRALTDNYFLMARIYKLGRRYLDAEEFYDRILTLAENNNFVAQSTPTEKAELYLLMKEYKNARIWLSRALDNYQTNAQNRPDLLIRLHILEIKLDFHEKKVSLIQAEEKLLDLFDSDHSEVERAMLYYDLYTLTGKSNYQKRALDLYDMLFQEIPLDEYNIKISELKSFSE